MAKCKCIQLMNVLFSQPSRGLDVCASLLPAALKCLQQSKSQLEKVNTQNPFTVYLFFYQPLKAVISSPFPAGVAVTVNEEALPPLPSTRKESLLHASLTLFSLANFSFLLVAFPTPLSPRPKTHAHAHAPFISSPPQVHASPF